MAQGHAHNTSQAEIRDTLTCLILIQEICYNYCLIIFEGFRDNRLAQLKVGSSKEIAFAITRNLLLQFSLVVLQEKTSTFGASHFDRSVYNQAKHVVRSQ